jgi:hypothetical protein
MAGYERVEGRSSLYTIKNKGGVFESGMVSPDIKTGPFKNN